jgi:D-alanyl-lipoteichoic acid acyltransferase DltB (MBOAT superfamily)
MLFNSFEFIFAFLPIVLVAFFLTARIAGKQAAIAFLCLASMFFYAWWNPIYLLLLVGEVCANFVIGRAIQAHRGRPGQNALVAAGIAFNLLILGFFKYALFFTGIVNDLAGTHWSMVALVLPLGISFHTFQQIAYLVQARQPATPRYPFLEYVLFVTFFPQLIAGPIVHHNEVIPQIDRPAFTRWNPRNFVLGLSIFSVGLFKKTVIADSLGQIASPAFAVVAGHHALGAGDAWMGALGYSLQLYFDFSAYSDMAIGLARMFNVVLPANFDSPYKAVNIADFWRRWHMTLSRFLRDFLYFPLGGNRKGVARAMLNVMITMLLGGLWHGAGWTFVIWGGLHGLYICGHRLVRTSGLYERLLPFALPRRIFAQAFTLFLIVIAWVFFRAADLTAAALMLRSMFGAGDAGAAPAAFGVDNPVELIAAGAVLALFAPNVIDIFARFGPALKVDRPNERRTAQRLLGRLQWRPTAGWGLATGTLAAVGALAILGWHAEFLYFQF